jgi:hypothetical protein
MVVGLDIIDTCIGRKRLDWKGKGGKGTDFVTKTEA